MADSWTMRAARALMLAWVFALVLAISPQTPDPAGPIKWLLTSGITAIIVLLCAGSAMFSREGSAAARNAEGILPFLLRHPLAWALAAFAGIYLIATIASPWPAQSLLYIAPWLNFVLFAFLIPRVCTRMEHVERMLLAAVAAVVLSSIYGFAQRLGYDPFPWSITDRYEYTGLPATYGHPNFAGHALVLGMVFAAGLAWPLKGRARSWMMLAVLVIALLIMRQHLAWTGMRAAWLALAAAVGAVAVTAVARRLTGKGELLRAGALGMVTLGVVVGVAALFVLLPRMANQTLPVDSSWILRLNGYLGATEMIADKPVLGWGPGQYREQSVPYWTPFEQRWFAIYNMRNDHVHNEFLEAAVDAGVPALAVTVGLVFAAAWTALGLIGSACARRRRFGYIALAAIAAFTVDAQFGFNLHTPVSAGLLFMLLGMCLAVARMGWEHENRWVPELLSIRHFIEACAAVATAGALVLIAAAHYYMEFQHQRSIGAVQWAAEREAPDDSAARAALEWAQSVMYQVVDFPGATAQHYDLLAQIEAGLGDNSPNVWHGRAIERNPHSPVLLSRAAANAYVKAPARRESAMTLFEMTTPYGEKERERPRELAQRAVEFAPTLAQAHDVLAKLSLDDAAMARTRGEEYESHIRIAIAHARVAVANTDEPEARYWRTLAEAYSMAGDTTAQQAALLEAAAIAPWNSWAWQELVELPPDSKEAREILGRHYAGARTMQAAPAWLPDLALGICRLYPTAQQFTVDAVTLFPTRMALWGEATRLGNGHSLTRTAELREQLGECDAGTERLLQMLDAVVQPMEARDAAAARKGLEALSNLMPSLVESGIDVWEEWRWVADMCAEALDDWPAQDRLAPLWLRVAGLYDAVGDTVSAAEIGAKIVPQLQGAEQGAAMLYQSKAARDRGDNAAALSFAQQAAARAPFALYVRWHLARCLVDAGRYVEADFEYMSQLQGLPPTSPIAGQMRKEHEAMQRRAQMEAAQ